MADNKHKLEQLSQYDLRELKGGIPYEKPLLLEMTASATRCAVGTHCDGGSNGDCVSGRVCSTGSHGDPNVDQEPN
jgi:hypothetical protein